MWFYYEYVVSSPFNIHHQMHQYLSPSGTINNCVINVYVMKANVKTSRGAVSGCSNSHSGCFLHRKPLFIPGCFKSLVIRLFMKESYVSLRSDSCSRPACSDILCGKEMKTVTCIYSAPHAVRSRRTKPTFPSNKRPCLFHYI